MKNKVVTDFLKAINSVRSFYFSQSNVYATDEGIVKNSKETLKYYERRLLASIFSQYSSLIERTNEYDGFNPDVEVVKPYLYGENSNKEIIRSFKYLRTIASSKGKDLDEYDFLVTIPDFVVHKSENSLDINDQLLIAELKTYPKMDEIEFFKDALKLNLYIEKYNFQNAIFVIVNKDPLFIKNTLSLYINNDKLFKSKKSSTSLYFVFRPVDNRPFEAYSISDIIEKPNEFT